LSKTNMDRRADAALSDRLAGADGEAMFRHTCSMGLEGIVSKRATLNRPPRLGARRSEIKAVGIIRTGGGHVEDWPHTLARMRGMGDASLRVALGMGSHAEGCGRL